MKWSDFDETIRNALEEDGVRDDVTTRAMVSENVHCRGEFLVKEDGVICGLPLARRVCHVFDNNLTFNITHQDGSFVEKGTSVANCTGPAASMLKVERLMLNYVQRLSGIATMTHDYVHEIAGTGSDILDTRKTTPGLRRLEKYAVRCGGGVNHRMGLHDMVLIKENHLWLWESCEEKNNRIRNAIHIARKQNPNLAVEVEVESIEELHDALEGRPDYVLVDNMHPSDVREAVKIVEDHNKTERKPVKLEASGAITLDNVRVYAETGVDRISIGALTHSVCALDISLRLTE